MKVCQTFEQIIGNKCFLFHHLISLYMFSFGYQRRIEKHKEINPNSQVKNTTLERLIQSCFGGEKVGGMMKANMEPIVSKIYCSTSQTVLTVRLRPHVISGGGFVVTNSKQKVVFKVDGCGVLGTKRELVLRDGDGNSLLLIRQKEGLVEVLSVYKKWKGYLNSYEGDAKLVFSLKEPASFLVKKNPISITVEPRRVSNKSWDFQINGSFPDRACNLIDSRGCIVAQVGVKKEIEHKLMMSKDVYSIVVQPGFDQAFVVGVIAVLDNIHQESTSCQCS